MKLSSYLTKKLFSDPKHLSFQLARYKFVSKMIKGLDNKTCLEVGLGDGLGSLIVSQESTLYLGLDISEENIRVATENFSLDERRRYRTYEPDANFGNYGVIFSLDVIEHMSKKEEQLFMKFAHRSLVNQGLLIVGTPNGYASEYASQESKKAHINLHTQPTILKLFKDHGFTTCLLFGMNDEVLHTGFEQMCHYIFIIGVKS